MNTKQLKLNITATLVAAAMVCTSWAFVSTDAAGQAKRVQSSTTSPWTALAVDGFEVENYSTMDAMVDSANATVLATVSQVRPGQTYVEQDGTQTYVSQNVEIQLANDEQLADTSVPGQLTLEFGPYPQADLEQILTELAALEGQQSVFVLRRKGAGVPIEGLGPNQSEYARGVYRLVSSQGLIDDADSVASVPLADLHEDQNAFLENLVDVPFEEVVAEVNDAG